MRRVKYIKIHEQKWQNESGLTVDTFIKISNTITNKYCISYRQICVVTHFDSNNIEKERPCLSNHPLIEVFVSVMLRVVKMSWFKKLLTSNKDHNLTSAKGTQPRKHVKAGKGGRQVWEHGNAYTVWWDNVAGLQKASVHSQSVTCRQQVLMLCHHSPRLLNIIQYYTKTTYHVKSTPPIEQGFKPSPYWVMLIYFHA